MTHPAVQHPRELLDIERRGVTWLNDLVGRIASSVLGSMTLFWTTFLVPLVVLPGPDSLKLLVSVVFSSWFQAWALPVLQRGSNLADLKRDAKADVDHAAFTHVATVTDDTNRVATHTAMLVGELVQRLGLDPVTGKDREP